MGICGPVLGAPIGSAWPACNGDSGDLRFHILDYACGVHSPRRASGLDWPNHHDDIGDQRESDLWLVRFGSTSGSAGALAGCLSSEPTEANPNADVDNNDNGLDNANPATNGIEYAIGSIAGGKVKNGVPVGANVGTWVQIKTLFDVVKAGDYKLQFAAVGANDTYGGLIDNVSVAPVPLPAAGFGLMAALGGLAAIRRRRKV